MTNSVTTHGHGDMGWQSDAALAYAIFRLTFGVNLMLRGVDRIFFRGWTTSATAWSSSSK